jgi:hypothetical protein
LGRKTNPREAEYGAMIKKKAKGKATKKKTATKKSCPRSKKERNPVAVHNDIAKIVESGAKRITKAVMEQAMAGQLAPAKFLLEMAQIFPKATDGSFSTTDEESLAATLLRRLDLPLEPVVRDEEDLAKPATSADKAAAKPTDEVDEKQSGTAAEGCEENKEPVLA